MKVVKPLLDYLLIEPSKLETTTPGGIVLPDTMNKEKPQEGKVVAVGSGRKTEDGKIVEMGIKVGDVVMYKKWGGTEIKIDGKDMLLVKEEDILAIVEE